jgi:hypothetical protein
VSNSKDNDNDTLEEGEEKEVDDDNVYDMDGGVLEADGVNYDGDPYGHPSHCYKGKSLLFNHGDLEGVSRLEMTGSTSSIQICMQTKKVKIKFCV